MGKINLVRIYENKENIQNHANYKGIKLTRHSIKLWIRVIEQRQRKYTRIIDNQIGFMSRRLTMKVIHLPRCVMERYWMDIKKIVYNFTKIIIL